jgi:peptidoglycan/LPS O-acetylase OafA/YrhL
MALLPGHAALMIFFVISGFVLRISLEYGPRNASGAAGKFALARLFRIYPLVFFVVVLTAILYGGVVHPQGQADRPLTTKLFFANLFLLDASMNGTLWALQVELLMAPVILLLYFLERSRGPRVLLGVALATTALTFWSRWAVWPPLSINVFPFVLGMLVPTLGRRFAVSRSLRAATCWTLAMAAVLVLTNPLCGLYNRYSGVIEAYAATVLVSLVAYRLDVSVLKFLDAKPLRLLGVSSGSYYVLHMLTPLAAAPIAEALVPAAWCVHYPALLGFFVLPIWLVAITPLALASFHCVEAPGIALGRRVMKFCGLNGRSVPLADSRQGERRLDA